MKYINIPLCSVRSLTNRFRITPDEISLTKDEIQLLADQILPIYLQWKEDWSNDLRTLLASIYLQGVLDGKQSNGI